MHRRLLALSMLFAFSVVGCGAGSSGAKKSVVDLTPQTTTPGEAVAPPLELDDASVTPFLLGPGGEMAATDFRPLMSEGEAYYEKWEMRVNGSPYQVRARFEVASLGFGDFKGRVVGYVKRRVEGEEDRVYKFDNSLSKAKWKVVGDGFQLEMGKVVLQGEPGHFRLSGSTGGKNSADFDVDITGESWRPGTGIVAFGDQGTDYYRTHILIAQGHGDGTVVIDGETHTTEGLAYGNHLASNLGVHEMAERVYLFRNLSDELTIEWRHFVTTENYEHTPFGYLVVSYRGVLIFESWEVTVQPHAYWVDEEHDGYSVERGVTLYAEHGEDTLELTLMSEDLEVTDPLERLPALERAVAESFVKPMDYEVSGPWRLDAHIDGRDATVDGEGSYTVTVMR